jgi:hypothetical protein
MTKERREKTLIEDRAHRWRVGMRDARKKEYRTNGWQEGGSTKE